MEAIAAGKAKIERYYPTSIIPINRNPFLAVFLDPRLKDTSLLRWGFSNNTKEELLEYFREVYTNS